MTPLEALTVALTVALATAGAAFFCAGTIGLLRFPDVYSRLHALTKADNLGLGLITLAMALQVSSLQQGLKLALIWLLVMLSGAVTCHLIARRARRLERGRLAGEGKDHDATA